MEQLKNRKSESQSIIKVAIMIQLFERYVDEPIEKITIWSSTRYLINDKWAVDLQTYSVERSYPDPDW